MSVEQRQPLLLEQFWQGIGLLMGIQPELRSGWALRDEARAFIFESEQNETIVSANESAPDNISLPFPVCYFEYLGEWALLSRYSSDRKEPKYEIYCALIQEESPGILNCWFSGRIGGLPKYWAVSSQDEQFRTHGINEMLRNMINKISERRLCTENCNVRLKVRGAHGSDFLKIKRIVRVVSKERPRSEVKPILGGTIDWSHRWEVMGHWRKTTGIGKNRKGEYEVKGYTWVIPHTKGPEHKVLVKKTRFVAEAEAPPA